MTGQARRLGAAFTLTLMVAAASAPSALGQEAMRFEGRVEASSEAALSTRLNGVVAEILFRGGETVRAGAPLIRLDPVDAKLDLAAAKAALAEAAAALQLAQQDDARAQTLQQREISTEARAQSAAAALKRAEARVALAEVEVARAEQALERTVIRSPIDGVVARPAVVIGAFVEAEAGPPLGRVLTLDPAVIAYRVPYETRLALLQASAAPSLSVLLNRLTVSITLPNGVAYPHRARPEAAAATVNPEDETITIRAYLPNPNTILRPGMAVAATSVLDEVP